MKKAKLKNCWLVNVPHCKYGYSFAVCAEGYNELNILDLCLNEGLFCEDEDVEIAFAEQMSEYDYEHFKDTIVFIE